MADDALDSHELSSFKELDSAASAIINSDQTPELSTEDKDGQSITHGNENDNKVAPAIIPSGGEPGDGPTVENANKSESDDHDEFYGHTPPRRRSPRKTFRRRARKIDEARNVGDYIEDLEMRVGSLEKEIIRLQRSLGIANADDLPPPPPPPPPPRASSPSRPPCCVDIPATIEVFDIKNWLIPRGYRGARHDKAIIKIALLGGSENNSKIAEGATKMEPSLKSKLPVRIQFKSPWIALLLCLLGGEPRKLYKRVMVRPFKCIITYEKQIKKFYELLLHINGTVVLNSQLVTIWKKTLRETFESETLGFETRETSDKAIYEILKATSALKGHFKKVGDVVSERQEVNEGIDDSQENGESIHEDDDGSAKLVSESSEPAKGDEPLPDSEEKSPPECTCLKDAKEHIGLLVKLMEGADGLDGDLTELTALRKKIVDGQLQRITFEDLWLLYQVGDIVVSSLSDRQAYRVLQVSGGRPRMVSSIDMDSDSEKVDLEPPQEYPKRGSKFSPFVINLVKLVFDGEDVGPAQHQIVIYEFEDNKLITELEVYPLRLAKEYESLRTKLVERGKFFVRLASIEHMRYSGLSVGEEQEEVNSEIITDFALAFRQREKARERPSWRPEIGFSAATKADLRELYEDDCPDNCGVFRHNDIYDDTNFDRKRMDDFISWGSDSLFKQDSPSRQTLSEDQLILLPTRIFAFALRNRKWVSLNIENVKEVEKPGADLDQKTGFENLVIPEEYKRIVKALVLNHSASNSSRQHDQTQLRAHHDEDNDYEVDLIKGKGKGLIILLHGVPGVGKTSTAESIAAFTQKPLFPITCGDIGQTAESIEKKLEELFLLARKWDCVLLLDEADVFLASRTPGDIKRNAMVSVFLRVLEYYSGILFLTTNRVGEFDEAFKSRIHISLYYPELGDRQARQVWEMNMDRLARSKRNIEFSRDDIKDFARYHWDNGGRWNGRQIRNAFQTAVALAGYDRDNDYGKSSKKKPKLTYEHFKSVADTSAEFDQYLTRVMGGATHGERNQKNEIRALDSSDGRTGKYSPYGTPLATRPRKAAPNIPNQSPTPIASRYGPYGQRSGRERMGAMRSGQDSTNFRSREPDNTRYTRQAEEHVRGGRGRGRERGQVRARGGGGRGGGRGMVKTSQVIEEPQPKQRRPINVYEDNQQDLKDYVELAEEMDETIVDYENQNYQEDTSSQNYDGQYAGDQGGEYDYPYEEQEEEEEEEDQEGQGYGDQGY